VFEDSSYQRRAGIIQNRITRKHQVKHSPTSTIRFIEKDKSQFTILMDTGLDDATEIAIFDSFHPCHCSKNCMQSGFHRGIEAIPALGVWLRPIMQYHLLRKESGR